MKNTYDVIIAGAGPVGLFLACELGLSGISVLVLERDESQSTILKSRPLGNRGLNIPSIEALYRRGLLESVLENSEERINYFKKNSEFQFAGHFAGIMLDANKLDLSRWKYRLNGPSILPVGAWVLEWTRTQVATLQPTLTAEATRKVIKDLLATSDGTNYFIDRVWGLSLRYDLGDEHLLVGSSVPDFELEDGSRLGEKMMNGKTLLIDFENNSSLLQLSKQWENQIDYLDLKVKDTLGIKALIVRPDGIVAWIADDTIDTNKAKTTLQKWLGKENIYA